MTVYYCPLCKRDVEGKKSHNHVVSTIFFTLSLISVWFYVIVNVFQRGLMTLIIRLSNIFDFADSLVFVLEDVFLIRLLNETIFVLSIGWLLLPLLYVLYYTFFGPNRCPICNAKLRVNAE